MAAPAVSDHEHRVGAPPGAQPSGVYRPRRPRASPLYGLLDRRFRHLSLVYDERFAHTYGPWRAVVPAVVDRFLACGILEHGFARIRCDACAHEYLLAFSCRSRYFCPSCHAKRLARWTLWLAETLLAPVPHHLQEREARPRVRMSACPPRASVRPCVRASGTQTHGSLANWHPHLHLVVTDGGFRPDGTFVRWPGWPAYDSAALSEAFRRAVLRLFVRRG